MQEAVARNEAHPMELKKQLADAILQEFWGAEQAEEGRRHFEELFQKRDFSQAQPITLPPETPSSLPLRSASVLIFFI